MATIDTVKEVLSENLDIDADQITEEATMEALGIDSLDMMELICDLEEKCDVEFGEPEGIETIDQARALVKEGCNFCQGFYYDRPMPVDLFERKYFGD